MSIAHQAMINMFSSTDPHTAGVYKFIMDLYPSFAKKVFERGDFMAKLVMSGMNPIEILDAPICGRCEAIAPLSGFAKKNGKFVNKCTCMREGCGHTTIDPITLKQWMKDELRHKTPRDFAKEIEPILDQVIDGVAMNMLKKAEKELSNAMLKEEQIKSILMPNGTEHGLPRAKIEVTEHMINDEDFNSMFNDTERID